MARARASDADQVAVAERHGHLVLLRPGALAQAVPTTRGRVSTISTRDAQQHGHDGEHPGGDDGPGPGLECPGVRVRGSPRHQAAQGRPDALEEVGHAGEVGQDVVAVEAHERQQLAQHLQDLGRRPAAGSRRSASAHQTPTVATATIALK